MLPKYNDIKNTISTDLDDETQIINKENEWFRYIQNGKPKRPYLVETKKLKKKPKIMYTSAKQRSLYDGK